MAHPAAEVMARERLNSPVRRANLRVVGFFFSIKFSVLDCISKRWGT